MMATTAIRSATIGGFWLLWALPVLADTTIAVLDFELNDLTGLDGGAQERERTASVRPLLERALAETRRYRPIAIEAARVEEANAGFGYLFDHPEAAAELGRAQGADFILVGRLHKPSFLFAYLMANLIDAGTGKVRENLIVEIKGQTVSVTARGAARLAERIDAALRQSGADR
ncbi:DUF2380 domain-containing protein [Thiocapsa rosea]|uniref:Uncharacterized protein DUF2380 n=1 Tax=Thiocapsa rosea TaxID=69360 RepID=A0A495VE94_9GAMM|nr:DUF2380 domain-containing protein [Thiocapsa rosea]RKT47130.1 uncharacterized protein DUF2380 [Thiocapsa rosea]